MRYTVPKWGWALIFIGLGITVLFFQSLPIVTKSTLSWPDGPEVQVRRTFVYNWGHSTYDYEYIFEGQTIDSLDSTAALPVKSGQSHAVLYFVQNTILGIYHPVIGGARSWDTVDVSNLTGLWWKRYLRAGGREEDLSLGEWTWEGEKYSDYSAFSIEDFWIRDKTWNITVGTQGVMRPVDGRSFSIPLYLFFSSTNEGKTWQNVSAAIINRKTRAKSTQRPITSRKTLRQ